jgi:eukaryotic-like serine/threonine-protein kinase
MDERPIFDAALDIPDPSERHAFLHHACAESPALIPHIEALLAAHQGIGAFLEIPAVQQLLPEMEIGSEGTVNIDSPDTDGGEDDDASVDLEFLQPSQKADSLGTLGHYEVLKVLGQGGFGIVLQAFDEKLHRLVALKVMNPQLAATSPPRKRFLQEARVVAAIRHENIVQVYSVEEQPLPYFVMELVSGDTLNQKLDATGPLEAAEVLQIGRQIAAGLAAAHASGLIHRDIKPGNVLVEDGPEPKVKITDFGLARAVDDASMTRSLAVSGTPMYMAPEQALGQKLDHRTDLFSLGSVLYQLACGRPPFRAASMVAVLRRVSEDTPRPLQEILPGIPDWLVAIISKLHAKRPEERFQSAQEVAELLSRCQSELQLNGRVTEASGLVLQSKQEPKAAAKRQIQSPSRPTAMSGGNPVARGPRIVALGAAGALLLALFVSEQMGVTHLLPFSHTRETSADPPSKNDNLTKTSSQLTGRQDRPANAPNATQAAMVDVKALPPTFKNSIGMEFVIVPKGKSWLGGGNGKLGDKEAEFPADFYLGKYEVTQEEWEKVIGIGVNPSAFSRNGGSNNLVKDISDVDLKRFPVEQVSWHDCQFFVERLNKLEKETDWVYRLPTEAEWEYASRGGPMSDKLDSAFSFYFDKPMSSLLSEQANFKDNGLNRPCQVGSYAPNKLGLYDMHGNVWEWCEHTFNATDRVYRGGGWLNPSEYCRAEAFHANPPLHRDTLVGLRLARVPSSAPSPEVKTPPTVVTASVDADVQRFAGMPATDQVEEVRRELKKRNPEFDGTLTQSIEDDVVTGLQFNTDHVADISPVRALRHLRSLDIHGTPPRKGLLSDLSPLQGMLLNRLDCSYTQVTELNPLRGMPLTILYCNYTPMSDLSPLEGVALVNLGIASTRVSNLSPLMGMKLQNLMATGIPAKDLTPLRGMPLKGLDLHGTSGITGLNPLEGMPLVGLNLTDLPVSDLSALQGQKTLRHINLHGTQVNDASLAQLQDCTNLTGLILRKTKVTAAGVDDLKKALPKCEVNWDGAAIDPMVPRPAADVLQDIGNPSVFPPEKSAISPPGEAS